MSGALLPLGLEAQELADRIGDVEDELSTHTQTDQTVVLVALCVSLVVFVGAAVACLSLAVQQARVERLLDDMNQQFKAARARAGPSAHMAVSVSPV